MSKHHLTFSLTLVSRFLIFVRVTKMASGRVGVRMSSSTRAAALSPVIADHIRRF